jgi:hypothetical protein
MSCSTTFVWPSIAPKMSAVLLPGRQLARSDGVQTLQSPASTLPFVALDVEVRAGVD